MGKASTTSSGWEVLLTMSLPLLEQAERDLPPQLGSKPRVPHWKLAALIMWAVLHRKKKKGAQWRFLSDPANRARWGAILGSDDLLVRSGWYARYSRAHQIFKQAIKLQGELAIREGIAAPRLVAVDKSLIAAQGPPWHKWDQKKGKVRPGTDREASWSYSKHDGWVYGYSFEIAVTATKNGVVFPLLASVDTASAAETKTCVEKLQQLPEETEATLLDSGYDANALAELVEWNAHQRRTGRRYLCPENPRHSGRVKRRSSPADKTRALSRQRRRQRKKFFQSPCGRRWYACRKKSVEPFNQWFKSLFELEQTVWHRGLKNNHTQLLAAIFTYQLLVRYNHRKGNKNANLRWITDAL